MMVKELHVATNLTELNSVANVPEAIKKAKAKQIINSAERILKSAQAEENKDEEMAYVHYMKFIECVQLALKKCNNEEKQFFSKLIGSQNVQKAMSKCETLSESLKKRYELSNLAKEKSKEDAIVAAERINSVKNDKEDGGTASVTGKLKPGMNGVTTTKPSAAKPVEPDAEEESSGGIAEKDLKNLIEQKSTTLLIIDCRSGKDFMITGHINHPNCISIPDTILEPGVTASKVTQSLKNNHPESYHSWNKRTEVDKIILYDWCSSFDAKKPALSALYDAMTKWDYGTTYKAKPYVLQGGVRAVYYSYPTLLNKLPNDKMPDGEPEVASSAKTLNLNNILYPTFDGGEVKPPQKPEPTPPPAVQYETLRPRVNGEVPSSSSTNATFDRSKKPLVKQPTPGAIVNGNAGINEVPPKDPSPPPPNLNNNNSNANIRPEDTNETTDVVSPKLSPPSAPKSLNDFKKIMIDDDEKPEAISKDRSSAKEITEAGGTFIKNDIGSASPKLGPSRPDPSTKPTRSRTNTSPGDENPTSSAGIGSPHFSITKLKDDSYESPRSSVLKRSHSNPNISQMLNDSTFHDGASVVAPIPAFNRTLKPTSKNYSGESYVRRREFDIVSSTERSETGLKNLGNTCYMNSIMQCINHTTTLVNYFLSQTYRNELRRTGPTRGEITVEVASAVMEMNKGHRSIGLNSLKQAFGRYNKTFRSIDQQDSHEFLTFLLDHLHEELNKKCKQPLPEQKNDNISDNAAAEQAWRDYLSSNDSIITELFCGQQKSCVTCVACNKSSSTFESFFVLSIPIPDSRIPGKRYSLQECLDLYTAEEDISDWSCEKCKHKGRAKKKIDLWRLPPTLIIHFQRFYIDSYYKKRITDIQFPIDDLNLTKLVKGQRDHPYCYQLYGTSNHYGTMDSGHYTAYCRKNKSWAKFDDQEVNSIMSGNVASPAAYILFYNQLDTP